MLRDDAVIIGYGTVGKATANALKIPWHYDQKDRNIKLDDMVSKKYVLFCLPTPTDEMGQQHEGTNVIDDYIKVLQERGCKATYIIRSTVLPGTTRRLAQKHNVPIGFVPEFLSEDTADEDARSPLLLVYGADNQPVYRAITELWQDIRCWKKTVTDTVTAETIKYALNMFFLTKIVFANQMYDACESCGADYEFVKHALCNHPWGTRHHLDPVHKGGRGGGGKCFPKDVKAFARYTGSPLLRMVDLLNDQYLNQSGKE